MERAEFLESSLRMRIYCVDIWAQNEFKRCLSLARENGKKFQRAINAAPVRWLKIEDSICTAIRFGQF
jgi:hypothetical protein